MGRERQRGEGKVGSVLTLLVVIAVGFAAINVAPVYFKNGLLKDKMNEIARSPRGTTNDDKILDMLDVYIREQGLDPYVQRTMFQVVTLDTSRRIAVTYRRPVKVLPGFTKTLTFTNEVSQPLIF